MKVNIYLTKEQNAQLTAISYKYQVSKSTIAEKVLFYFTKWLMQEDITIEEKTKLINDIGTTYLYKDNKGSKTSIKPKINPTNNGIYKNLTKAYTNLIVIYLKKDFKTYVKQNTQKLCSEINTALQTTHEENWDYNRFIRSMKRYERKQNA